MKIIFKTLRYKNILSTGNTFTTIDLNKSELTLISGSNGAGKTTILDALTFVLYGKPYRNINKSQLVNTINKKNLVVELEFSIGAAEYKICRGIKPNIFEIYYNDTLIDQSANVKDYQKYLETDILRLNLKSFCQIVVLGSTTFIPFMQLTPAHRREILEDILDMQIFTNMGIILKEKISENRDKISKAQTMETILREKIDGILKYKQRQKEDTQKTVDIIQNKVADAQEEIDANLKAIDENNKLLIKYEPLVKEREELLDECNHNTDIAYIQQKIKRVQKDIDFYEHNKTCPTCTQNIEDGFRNDIITEKSDEMDKLSVLLKISEENIVALQNSIKEKDEYYESEQRLKQDNYRRNIVIEGLYEDIKKSERMIADIQKNSDETNDENIEEYNEKLKKTLDIIEKKTYLKGIYEVAAKLLKDTGIKAKIIQQYVPIINQQINKYLGEMDFFVKFELSETFEETIKSRFRDTFSYASFSEGEKTRINLAILFTWREISKTRNSTSTNLLVFDEVLDSSTDLEGLEAFFSIINTVEKDSNVFVISHTQDQFTDKFKDHIRFKKVKNFSIKE